MNNKELRQSIRKILFEGYGDSEIWSDFDSDEMMGTAQQDAMRDIESAGEEFKPVGKNKFEKKFDVDKLISDLETQKSIKSAALQRIQKQIDQLQKFGGGSLNESPELDRPKDSKGQPITLKTRVEDNTTNAIGHVQRFGIDDNGKMTVHVSWISNFGQNIPKSIVYPNTITVKDSSKTVNQ